MRDVLEAWRKSREFTERADEDETIEKLAQSFRSVRESVSLLERESLSAKIASKEEEMLSFILEDYLIVELEKTIFAEGDRKKTKRTLRVIETANEIRRMVRQTVENIRTGNQRNHEIENLFWEQPETSYKLVVALKEVQQFVGVDGKKHGPMKSGDLITIPARDAEILISGDFVQDIE